MDNAARSQMAEAFLRKYTASQFLAFSAGLEPAEIHPAAIQVMAEIGIDLSAHSSKSVDLFRGQQLIQTLIILCDQAEKNFPTVWPGVTLRLHWSIPDPGAVIAPEAEKLAAYRTARDQIDAKLREWLAEQRFPPVG